MRFWAFQILRLPALEWPIFHPSMENGPFKNRKNLAKSTKINSYIKWVWNLPTVMIDLPCYMIVPRSSPNLGFCYWTALASSDADIRLRRERLGFLLPIHPAFRIDPYLFWLLNAHFLLDHNDPQLQFLQGKWAAETETGVKHIQHQYTSMPWNSTIQYSSRYSAKKQSILNH